MNFKFPLLSLCTSVSLLAVFVGRSEGGVTNLCEPGKFYDSSKQEYRPCSECKPEIQDCLLCCQPGTENRGMNQDEGGKTKNVSTLNSPPEAADIPGTNKEKTIPSTAYSSLPNILVVSIISLFIFSSLLILLYVLLRAFRIRHVEANEGSSDTQRSEVVTEVMMVEVNGETDNCDTTARDDSVCT